MQTPVSYHRNEMLYFPYQPHKKVLVFYEHQKFDNVYEQLAFFACYKTGSLSEIICFFVIISRDG